MQGSFPRLGLGFPTSHRVNTDSTGRYSQQQEQIIPQGRSSRGKFDTFALQGYEQFICETESALLDRATNKIAAVYAYTSGGLSPTPPRNIQLYILCV
jgi:hypothetical protein